MKRILQIDGGGIMGVMPSTILAQLEKRANRPLCDCFDLITGTSTGAIIGGAIAAGVSAKQIASLYFDKGRDLFTKRPLWVPFVHSKYDRGPFITEIAKTQTENRDEQGHKISLGQIKLSDLNTLFMATAFNLCSRRTHFIKSWYQKDQPYPLVDVISWSALSAAYYFGKINRADYKWCHYEADGLEAYEKCRYALHQSPNTKVQKQGAVFQDGGQGAHNNTLGYILMEIMTNSWTKNQEIYILSLGSGDFDPYVPYQQAMKITSLKETLLYFFQARGESIVDQVLAAFHVSRVNPKIHFKRLDKTLNKEEVGLDKVSYIEKYHEYGLELSQQITDEELKIITK
jgi:uncharacterized protein